MPDLVPNKYAPTPENRPKPLLEGYTRPDLKWNVTGTVDPIMNDLIKQKSISDFGASFSTPYESQLTNALRYTDPEIGYNPTDVNLEDTYARAHPYQTFFNNIGQGASKFLGTGLQTLATIPLLVGSAIYGDWNHIHNNTFTTAINSWMDDVAKAIPTYRTNYEQDHPFLKYLSVWDPTSLFGAWGEGINNLGFMAGAIGGALAQDALITLATGGVALPAIMSAQMQAISKMLPRVGKAFATGSPRLISAELNAARQAGQYAQNSVLTRAVMNTGDDLVKAGAQSVPNPSTIIGQTGKELSLRPLSQMAKLRDGIKYETALFTSATGEGTFEAAETYHQAKDSLKQQFFDKYGRAPIGTEETDIEGQAQHAARRVLNANIALLYMSNRLNWSSLFKPTDQAKKEIIAGWGSKIRRETIASSLDPKTRQTLYSVAKNTPDTKIGKLLLNGERFVKTASKPLGESLEEGSQYMISNSNIDYVLNKYNPNNLQQIGNYIDSFYKSFNDLYSTNEGLENLSAGFVGGLLGGGLSRIGRKNTSESEKLNNAISILNQHTFKGGLAPHILETSAAMSLSEKYANAVKEENTYEAKTIKSDLEWNWVKSGVKAKSFDKRLEELNMVRELEGESFTDYWGLEYNEENVRTINEHLDNFTKKAKRIKKDVEYIENITQGNPFDSTKNPEDYQAYESYKDQLGIYLNRVKDGRERYTSLESSLREAFPSLNINETIKATSYQGIRETIENVDRAITDIDKFTNELSPTEPLYKTNKEKKNKLKEVRKKLKSITDSAKINDDGKVESIDFNGKDYTEALNDLFNLYSGADLQNNNLLSQQGVIDIQPSPVMSSDEIADKLQELQDLYRLVDDLKGFQTTYTYLRTGRGQSEIMKKIKEEIQKLRDKYVGENGQIKTDKDIEDEERAEAQSTVDLSNVPAEEQDILKEAARKEASGEELTEEEQSIIDEHPKEFADLIQAENKLKTTPAEPKRGEKSPLYYMLFDLYKNPEYRNAERNTHEEIFNNGNSSLFGKSFYVQFHNRNRIADEESINIPGTELYRKQFEGDVIVVKNSNHQIIGEIRQPTSIFLDSNMTIPFFTEAGEMNITEEEFSKYFPSSETTYKELKRDAENFFKQYTEMYNEIEKSPKERNYIIPKHFVIESNNGALRLTNDSKNDTDLRDVNIKNHLVLKFIENVNGDGQKSFSVEILENKGHVTKDIEEAVSKYVNNNYDHFKSILKEDATGKYMVFFPVRNKVQQNAFVRARMKEQELPASDKYSFYENNLRLSTTPDVFEGYSLSFVPKTTKAEAAQKQEYKPIRVLGASLQEKRKNLKTIFISLFNQNDEQATASVEVFMLAAKSWAKRENKPIEDFFEQFSFGDKKLYQHMYENSNNPQEHILFSTEDFAQIDIETNQIEKTYNENETNLPEDLWKISNTPTFKKWFKDSKAVDNNKEPLIYYIGKQTLWSAWNNTQEQSGPIRNQLYLTTDSTIAEENGFTKEVFVSVQNPFDYDNPKHKELFPNLPEGDNFDFLESEAVQKVLKEKGFDGFYVKENGVKNLEVYDVNQIKSSNSQKEYIIPDMIEENDNITVEDIKKCL